MTLKEAVHELHDRVRQCFTRHKFKTFGDALDWWHNAGYDAQKLEAGEQGMSKFSTDLMWIVSCFGPQEAVDYKIMATRKVPALKPVVVDDPDQDEPEPDNKTTSPASKTSSKQTPRRKARRRRRF